MPQFLISDEIHKLVIKDCVKRFGSVQDCGIFANVCGSDKHHPHKIFVIASYFATTKNNKQEWIIIEDKEILDRISLLYERTNENWSEMLITCNVKADKYSIEFFNLYNPARWDYIGDYPKMIKYYKFKLKML